MSAAPTSYQDFLADARVLRESCRGSRDLAALVSLAYDWEQQARPAQLAPPGDWFIWVNKGGRGSGKTRTAGEYVRRRIDAGEWRVVNAVAATKGDVRKTLVEGESGLLSLWPPHQRPEYQPSRTRVVCHTGAIINLFSADEPDRLRGPQADGGWADEIDAWKRRRGEDAWSNFELGIRLGPDPRIVASSTPKRSRLVRYLVTRYGTRTWRDLVVEQGLPARSGTDLDSRVLVVTGESTYANAVNLAPQWLATVVGRYRGTSLGRQEIGGELLAEVDGALLTPDAFVRGERDAVPDLVRVSTGVDPSGGAGVQGIVPVGLGVDDRFYVLDDASCRKRPEGWGRRVVETHDRFRGDRVVAERNFGGDMVRSTIQNVDRDVPVKLVPASRGKHVRFEPIALLYEQGRVVHVGGPERYELLEDQLTSFTPTGYEGEGSPDRADALVWAITDLSGRAGRAGWDLR